MKFSRHINLLGFCSPLNVVPGYIRDVNISQHARSNPGSLPTQLFFTTLQLSLKKKKKKKTCTCRSKFFSNKNSSTILWATCGLCFPWKEANRRRQTDRKKSQLSFVFFAKRDREGGEERGEGGGRKQEGGYGRNKCKRVNVKACMHVFPSCVNDSGEPAPRPKSM